jgi:hypothetical protein
MLSALRFLASFPEQQKTPWLGSQEVAGEHRREVLALEKKKDRRVHP